MAVYSALDPVTAGVRTVLNVSGLTSIVTGGIADDISQAAGFPFLLIEVFDEDATRSATLGTKPGTGRVLQVDLRLHVFTKDAPKKLGQQALAKAIQLLADPPAVTGYASWAIFHERTLAFDDVEVAGQKVTEQVAMLRLHIEEGV